MNEIWHVSRGRWVIHDGMPYEPIQGQRSRSRRSSICENLLRQYACNPKTNGEFYNINILWTDFWNLSSFGVTWPLTVRVRTNWQTNFIKIIRSLWNLARGWYLMTEATAVWPWPGSEVKVRRSLRKWPVTESISSTSIHVIGRTTNGELWYSNTIQTV